MGSEKGMLQHSLSVDSLLRYVDEDFPEEILQVFYFLLRAHPLVAALEILVVQLGLRKGLKDLLVFGVFFDEVLLLLAVQGAESLKNGEELQSFILAPDEGNAQQQLAQDAAGRPNVNASIILSDTQK